VLHRHGLWALFSIPIYYLSARNIAHKAYIYQPVRIVCDLIRTIPTMTLRDLRGFDLGHRLAYRASWPW
jgi:hypothetical protein